MKGLSESIKLEDFQLRKTRDLPWRDFVALPINSKVVVSIFVSSMVIALCSFRRIFKNPATDQRVREGVLRYVDSGDFIDRSGV